MRSLLKNLTESIPYSIGKYLVKVPFSWRLGKDYTYFKNLIEEYQHWNDDRQANYLIEHINAILDFAWNNIPFYRKFYQEHGISSYKINYLDQFEKFPILSKDNARILSKSINGFMLLNTGGSSGIPFSFYVDKNAFAREWAHMHYIWNLAGYKVHDLKLTLRGKNIDRYVKYNAVHNEFIINTYQKVNQNNNKIMKLFHDFIIKYVHGYPSAVYNFFKELEICTSETEKKIIKRNLRSCLLGSEFPAQYMKDYLLDKWNLNSISWYGHSEMCVLAYDKNSDNRYYPLYTYGFVEEVGQKLIGTSFHNYDMPLIRYDTNDIVNAKKQDNGLINYFSITAGRQGDFVTDRDGVKIPLTALLFGRHHKIFNIAKFIQVGQQKNGEVTFYVTLNCNNHKYDLSQFFDISNVNIECNFVLLQEPILTKTGKFKLKVDK